jgi:hypothetical protein
MFHILKKLIVFKKKTEIELLQPDIDSYLTYLAISKAIKGGTPFLASRIGYTEARSLAYPAIFENPPQKIMDSLWHSSGVFPAEPSQFNSFAKTYIAAAKNVDVMALMNYSYESLFLQTQTPDVTKCLLKDFSPYFYPYPWSMHLEGLDVLVIHPFTASIQNNYHSNRKNLFFDERVLPSFNLKTIKSPQTLVGNTDRYSSWDDAFDNLKEKVSAVSFDVALIGCGAYGLPIGGFIKNLGKTAIHLGADIQLLFGITGKRWETNKIINIISNQNWTRPIEIEKPNDWSKMESGCYW